MARSVRAGIAASAPLLAFAIAACSRAGVTAPHGTVQFVLVAPLCSSVIPVQFSIDGVRVGADTFRVNVSGPHTTSRGFSAPVGAHTLGAQVTGSFAGGYVWPAATVTVSAGQTAADSLSFYCS